jgi:hypothetical protein
MKRTPEDDVFAKAFGNELRTHYERATRQRSGGVELSDEQFAATLDVTRPALMKYLAGGAMPGLRVVVLAYIRYGINVPYFEIPLFQKRRQKSSTTVGMTQLILPFSVQGLNTAMIDTKIKPTGANRFELRVSVRTAG